MQRGTLPLGLLCWCLAAWPAQGQGLSQVPAAFVDVGLGARPVAMGQAYVGLANDAYSVFWNPAGIALLAAPEVAFAYLDHLGLVPYQHVAAVVPLPRTVHGLGLGLVASGDPALREMVGQVGYAFAYGGVAFGVMAKYRRATFGNNVLREEDYVVFEPDEVAEGLANQVQGEAQGVAIDIGLLFRPVPRVAFGLVLRDVYAPVWWQSHTANAALPSRGSYQENIPFEAVIGTVYHVLDNLSVTADYSPALDDERADKVRVGLEATLLQLFRIRGGMQQRLTSEDEGRYAAGFGLRIPMGTGIKVSADYTYLREGFSPSPSQHVSLALQF